MEKSFECPSCGYTCSVRDKQCPYCGSTNPIYNPTMSKLEVVYGAKQPIDPKVRSQQNGAVIFSIVAIVFCWIPFVSLILSFVSLIISCKTKFSGAIALSAIALILSIIYFLPMFFAFIYY